MGPGGGVDSIRAEGRDAFLGCSILGGKGEEALKEQREGGGQMRLGVNIFF